MRCMSLLLALTARSLHCRDSVRLQSYFHRPDEPVSTPPRDPDRPSTEGVNGKEFVDSSDNYEQTRAARS